ncbi:tetratricopeptide repeat protein [Legionella hackeliae]|uniref:FAD/NAD(P)-binding domain-containing protein n=1 Tax=Legionella hackeliae TaxID=449 RepID=A0A0A8UUT1_LEGHA|nr:hypothetical protein [Legionella hackeliae]KTD13843.1 hypothetical protein Lhac_0687 [Legionella hackeliae]CEK10544.1 protein of unknown function [Legionella hackeliae]STX47283.1 Predicted O-linked N-acetylglucosamine transferase, SPINDLY family [Legionella hackeliae]
MGVIIVGDGPSGLYAAIQLKKAGVKDVKIIGPREGKYVRPGHINQSVFYRAEKGIGKRLRSSTETAHIKDIERALYKEVNWMGIPIIKGSFVQYSDKEKGIVVSVDGLLHVEICDFVLDCTGPRRVLVHALNKRAEERKTEKPFEISPVSKDVLVKNHMLAYVKMSAKDVRAADNGPRTNEYGLHGKSPLEYANAMERLRQFGWREMAFPRCYNMTFGKDKVCFYVEAPDNLPDSQKEAWFQAVLESTTGDSTISYKLLPAPKKYESKPRLTTFTVDPKQINRFSYQEKGLPCTITQGDAQIEPNYYLAHGIVESFERIDAMVKGLIVIGGVIHYFDGYDYEQEVKEALVRHQTNIIKHYKERKEFFEKWLYDAKKYYEEANKAEPKPLFQERLIEIQARIAYYDAIKTFETKTVLFKGVSQIPVSHFNPVELLSELTQAKEGLIKAITELSHELFEHEVNDAKEKLEQLAFLFKDVGNQLYKTGKFDLALQSYEQSLELYQNQASKVNEEEIFTLYSNIILTYRKLNQLPELIMTATKALQVPDKVPETIRKKILYNVITQVAANIQDGDSKPVPELVKMHQLNQLCDQNKVFISAQIPEVKEELILIQRFINKSARFQELGKKQFAEQKFSEALESFKTALTLTQQQAPRDHDIEALLQSNIVLVHRKLSQPKEAFSAAIEVFETSPTLSSEIKKKILFNCLKAISEAIISKNKDIDKCFIRKVAAFYVEKKEFREQCSSEAADALDIVTSVLGSVEDLREFARLYYSQAKPELSLATYEDGLLVQRFSKIRNVDAEASLAANIILLHRNLNSISQAIPLAENFLNSKEQFAVETKKKIIFNLLKGLVEKNSSSSDKILIEKAHEIYLQHQEFIGKELAGSLKTEIQLLNSLDLKTVSLGVARMDC